MQASAVLGERDRSDARLDHPFPLVDAGLVARRPREAPRTRSTVPGRIEVTPSAIATLAARTVGAELRRGRPGVAALPPGAGRAVAQGRGQQGRGSGLHSDRIVIDLYVILEYGTRIITVAENMMSSVKFAVEQALGRRSKSMSMCRVFASASRRGITQAGTHNSQAAAAVVDRNRGTPWLT